MSVAPALFIAGTAISAGASVIGGIAANQAAKRERALLEEQGRLAQEEADREARAHAQDVRKFHRLQSLAFIKNGVNLGGSPLLVLDETMRQGQEEADSIARSGAAERTLYNRRGVMAQNAGRAALVGGFGQAAGTVASGAVTARKAGLI